MRICWCTIKVQPNTLVNFKEKVLNYFQFFKFYFAADFYERLRYFRVCTRFILTISASGRQFKTESHQNENQIQIW